MFNVKLLKIPVYVKDKRKDSYDTEGKKSVGRQKSKKRQMP